VAAYRTLVDNPGDRWDYPDRVALLRNLRALGERTEIEHRCRDLTHPPIFGFGWLIARRACAGME